MPAAIDGSLPVDELLSEYFVRDLHTRLYGLCGTGPDDGDNRGQHRCRARADRRRLRTTLDTIFYRWQHADDWHPRELGITTHADTVRIHPFTDGNGRTTSLLADLVSAAAQDPSEWQYDWNV